MSCHPLVSYRCLFTYNKLEPWPELAMDVAQRRYELPNLLEMSAYADHSQCTTAQAQRQYLLWLSCQVNRSFTLLQSRSPGK